jgi:hypothetical protein
MALRTVAPITTEKQRTEKHNYRWRNWTGEKIGRLVVGECLGKRMGDYPVYLWKCVCECGAEFVTSSDSLRSGRTVSCGCANRDKNISRATHRSVKTAEYGIWIQIKRRCDCPRYWAYRRYGGRGITMCDTWRNSFLDFLRDIGERPSSKHSIDRINNDGNYEPGNVRWATSSEQCRNRRSNRLVTVDGVTKTIIEWSEFSGIKWCTINARLGAGWEPRDAISLPLNTRYWLTKDAKQQPKIRPVVRR